MNVICKAAALAGIICEQESEDFAMVEQRYMEHIAKFGISYGTDEEYQFRLEQFAKKDAEINEINAEENTYILGHNKFSTWTKDEYKRILKRKPASMEEGEVEELDTEVMDAEVDWRAKGAVNAVQNQGQCGSCWAFSSVAAMEGSHFINKGKLLKLSEQQFVDCASTTGNEGCNGGLEVWAFKYAEKAPLELEVDYPYKAKTGKKCKAVKAKEVVAVESYKRVPKKKVAQLKAAVAKQPTCVSVDAANSHFQMYTGGILDTTKCGTDLDHAVTAVGYGSESGKEYLIVRNSWGADWGEKGYIRMAIDKDGDGVCGVLMDSARPDTN
jgi:C1A family cysteine protease